MPRPSFVTLLFNSDLSLDDEPLTSTQMRALVLTRRIGGPLLLIFGIAAAFLLPTMLPPHGAMLNSIIVVIPMLSLLGSGFFLTIAGCQDDGHHEINPSMCVDLLEACKKYPAIEAYRTKVLAQNRTFTKIEYAMLMQAEEQLDPQTLIDASVKEAAEAAACRELHGIA